jgi:putative beta-lysine N-acetyltransferase
MSQNQQDQPMDQFEQIDGAQIQHGKYNDRIYLMKIGDAKPEKLFDRLQEIAEKNDYSKIFAKVPESAGKVFCENGYQCEAIVPKYFHGEEDGWFLGHYLDPKRAEEPNREELEEIIELAKKKAASNKPELDSDFEFRPCLPEDAEEMVVIYKEVFPTYPFPIHDPEYIRETMESHIEYFAIEKDEAMVALSSAEKDLFAKSVEMTDFATLPDYRGKGLASYLLMQMEKAMEGTDIKTAYTIARSVSPGMNITFAKLGYQYGGRLVHNTNISGQMESMNIWYKML